MVHRCRQVVRKLERMSLRRVIARALCGPTLPPRKININITTVGIQWWSKESEQRYRQIEFRYRFKTCNKAILMEYEETITNKPGIGLLGPRASTTKLLHWSPFLH